MKPEAIVENKDADGQAVLVSGRESWTNLFVAQGPRVGPGGALAQTSGNLDLNCGR